jgi:hypothetical protein
MTPTEIAQALRQKAEEIQNSISFLDSVEWNDRTSEDDAANWTEELRKVVREIESLAASLEGVPSGWQPRETAPKHQAVLGFYEQYGEALTVRRGERGWSVAGLSERYNVQPPTHWMPPLPSPPETTT